MKYIKALIDKIPDTFPMILLQLITIAYLIIIGMYLPVASTEQLIMKLGIMSLGLFASWKLYDFMKAAKGQHATRESK